MSQQERKWKRKEERKCVCVCNPIIPDLIISGKAATRKFDNTRRVANIPLKTTYFAVVIYRHLISLVSISAIVKISCGQDKYLFCHNGSPGLERLENNCPVQRFSGFWNDYGSPECRDYDEKEEEEEEEGSAGRREDVSHGHRANFLT